MKAAIAKEAGYTHLGKMYGVYCYMVMEENGELDIHGTNWFRRRALDFFIWIECYVYSPTGEFRIEIIEIL